MKKTAKKKKIVLVIRWIFSSNINEGIKAVLFFKQKDFTRTKSPKRKQATFTQIFFTLIKSIKSIKSAKKYKKAQKSTKAQKAQKAQNAKQATFFLLDVFCAHKNVAFFVFVRLDNFRLLCFFTRKFYTHKKHKKHKKHIKSIKTQVANRWLFSL